MPGTAEELRYKYLSSGTELTIPARTGFSHRIIDVWIDSPADKSYMDIYVGNVIVTRIPVKWANSLFVAPYTGSKDNISIMALIRELFGNDYFVEADESEDIKLAFSATQTGIHVLYEEVPGGIDKTKPLRSLGADKVLFAILTHSKAIDATGTYKLDSPVVPTGFPNISDGFTFPSGREFGIVAVATGTEAVGSSKPTVAHLWRENFEFFTPTDHSGVSIDPSSNFLVADINTADIFRVPEIVYKAGQKITAEIEATYDGTNAIPAGTEALILIGMWRGAR